MQLRWDAVSKLKIKRGTQTHLWRDYWIWVPPCFSLCFSANMKQYLVSGLHTQVQKQVGKCLKASKMAGQLKAYVTKPDNLNSILGIHMMKREKRLLQIVFWSPCTHGTYSCTDICVCTKAHIKQRIVNNFLSI